MKGLRILELRASMFKGVEAVEIKPTNPIVRIEGPNGSGKTSILDVIEAMRGSKFLPEQPVKLGAMVAKNEVVIGDEKPEIIITREMTPDGPTKIKVTRADGSKYDSPQKMLNDLFNGIAFDPMEFIELKPLARVEMLKKALGINFDEEDKLLEKLEIERTEAFQKKKGAEYSLSKYEHEAPVTVSNIADTQKRRLDAIEFNNEIDRSRIQLDEATEKAEDVIYSINEKTQLIDEFQVTVVEFENKIKQIKESLLKLNDEKANLLDDYDEAKERAGSLKEIVDGSPEKKDLQQFDLEIQRHGDLVARAERYKIKVDFQKGLVSAEKEWADKENAISQVRLEKRRKIAAAKMPLTGLDFDTKGTITLNNIDIAQINTASQLEVAVHICIALDSKLKVIRIKNGSMIDSEGMKKLEKIAYDHGQQIWLEVVEDSKTSADSFFISEGRVQE